MCSNRVRQKYLKINHLIVILSFFNFACVKYHPAQHPRVIPVTHGWMSLIVVSKVGSLHYSATVSCRHLWGFLASVDHIGLFVMRSFRVNKVYVYNLYCLSSIC